MALIKKKDVEKLLNVQNGLCISIYIPTHKVGNEVLRGQDQTLFKNKIREAKALLARHDVTEVQIEEYLKPAEELLGDNNFWRHQSEGLAVFITKGYSQHFRLPTAMPEMVYVLDQFYFTPILPLLSQNGRFFVLWLYRDNLALYEATMESIRQVDTSSFLPDNMTETPSLKFDERSHDQDFHHSRTTVNGSNIVHGPGSQKGDLEHHRVREFVLDVDAGLHTILHDSEEPLILAGVDHYCALFRKFSKYKHIVDETISVNENTDVTTAPQTIHEKALAIMMPLMQQSHVESLDRYQNMAGTGVTSEDIATVAAEAVHGRVDTLFIAPGQPIWGSYDAVNATAVVHDEYQRGDDDLVNLAAIKTLSQGGRVFVSSYNGMSEVSDNGNVKALFRY